MFTLIIRFRGLCVFQPKPNRKEGMHVLLVDGRAPGDVSTKVRSHVSHASILAVPPRYVTTTPAMGERLISDEFVADELARVFVLDGAVLTMDTTKLANPDSLGPGSTVGASDLTFDAKFDDGVPKLASLYQTHLPAIKLNVDPEALNNADPRIGGAVARQFLTHGTVSAGGLQIDKAQFVVLGSSQNLGDPMQFSQYVEYRTTVQNTTVDMVIDSASDPKKLALHLDPHGDPSITIDICNLPLFGVEAALGNNRIDEDYELIYRVFKPNPAARLVLALSNEVPGHLCIGGCSSC